MIYHMVQLNFFSGFIYTSLLYLVLFGRMEFTVYTHHWLLKRLMPIRHFSTPFDAVSYEKCRFFFVFVPEDKCSDALFSILLFLSSFLRCCWCCCKDDKNCTKKSHSFAHEHDGNEWKMVSTDILWINGDKLRCAKRKLHQMCECCSWKSNFLVVGTHSVDNERWTLNIIMYSVICDIASCYIRSETFRVKMWKTRALKKTIHQ